MANKIPTIRLSDDKQLELSKMLNSMMLDAQEAKGQWPRLHADYMRMYLTQPKQAIRTFPWVRANNFVPPVVRSHVDSFGAHVFDAMFSTMPRVVGIEGSDITDAELLSLYYFDFLWNGPVLNLRKLANEWNFDTNLDGIGIVKNRWNKSQHLQRLQTLEPRMITESLGEEFLGEPLQSVREEMDFVETAKVRRINLPAVETAPVATIFPAPGSGPSMQWPQCPWFYEEVLRSEAELNEMKRAGFANIDELMVTMNEPGFADAAEEQREYEDLGSRQLKKARVQFYFMRLALPGQIELIDDADKQQAFDAKDGFAEEVIITYLPDLPLEERISKIVPLARLRGDNKRPYVENRYNTLPRQWYGQGIAAKLRMNQTQVGVAFRQLADTGTLRNLPWGMYNPAMTGLIKPNSLRPGAMLPVQDPRGVVMQQFHGDMASQVTWMNLLDKWAEKDTSVTDNTQGRSSSQPNQPRTARGLQALLDKGDIAFGYRVSLYREQYAELFRQVHELHKFNASATEPITFRVLNQQTGVFQERQLSASVFQQEVDFLFELSPNKLQDQQNSMTLLDTFVNFLPSMVQFPQTREFFAKVYKSFGNKDLDTIFPREMLEQFAAQQQEAAAVQAGQQPQAAQPAPGGGEQSTEAPPAGELPFGANGGAGIEPDVTIDQLTEEEEMVQL